jgi:hypothetical protein
VLHFSIAVNTVATGHVRVGISRRPRLAHDHHRQERRAIRSPNHISEQPLQRLQVGSRKVAHAAHDKPLLDGAEERLDHRCLDESSASLAIDHGLAVAQRRSHLARDRHERWSFLSHPFVSLIIVVVPDLRKARFASLGRGERKPLVFLTSAQKVYEVLDLGQPLSRGQAAEGVVHVMDAALFGNRFEPLGARRTVAAEPARLAEELLEVCLPVFGARAELGHDAGYCRRESRLARPAEPGRPVHEFKIARQGNTGQHPFASGTGRGSILERAEPVGLLEVGLNSGGGD